LACGVLLFGRLDGFDDYVERAEASDLFLSGSAGTFPYGEHCDNRRNTEYDAKSRKRGAEAVEPQALDAQFNRSSDSI
jgi:hypothetical protein